MNLQDLAEEMKEFKNVFQKRIALIDDCERLRSHIEQYVADQDNAIFWRWDRAYWYATRALKKLGIEGSCIDIDAQIADATDMMGYYQ